MSTVAISTDEPLANLLFDYPGADIILRSQDGYHFRVPKTSIVSNSPILCELIRRTLDSPGDANVEASLPVVQLPEDGEIVHCLLTFIYPVTPLLPSTPEKIMELLSVAQKNQMESTLTHIRGSIARQSSLPTRLESALHIYALSQKYGLRPEALQSARAISMKQLMTIEDFDNKLDIMPGASLYELWKYHERVRAILVSDLLEFRRSGAHGTITDLRCTEPNSSQIPRWLDRYIESIGQTPNLFDIVKFNIAMVRHIKDWTKGGCECASIPSHTVHDFWEALASVVHGGFEKAESSLSLVRGQEDHRAQINSATSPVEPFDVSDANFIIRSSDNVNFRVHKSILAMVSPFFRDLLSLPQPSDSEIIDGLPVVQLSESSELLYSLISILYPVRTVMPNSYEKVLYLLAACQKYDMVSVQSSIRAKVSRGASPVPKGAEAFTAYAIASAKELIPEMENSARQTLDQPMTFEILGDGLRLFEGWALRDLVGFRKRCRDNLITCFGSFLEVQPPGPSSIWVGCPEVMPDGPQQSPVLPRWLYWLLSRSQKDLKLNFTSPLTYSSSTICRAYAESLRMHANCVFCSGVDSRNGSTFCAELENKLAQARNKVCVRGNRGLHSG